MKKLLTEEYYIRLTDMVGNSIHTTKEMYEIISVVNTEFGVKSAAKTMSTRLTNYCEILGGTISKEPDTDTVTRGRGIPMIYCIESVESAVNAVREYFNSPRKRLSSAAKASAAILGARLSSHAIQISGEKKDRKFTTLKRKLLRLHEFFMSNKDSSGTYRFKDVYSANQFKEAVNIAREEVKILITNYWVSNVVYNLPSKNEMIGYLLNIDSYMENHYNIHLDTASKLGLRKVGERTAEVSNYVKDINLITYRSFIIAGILLTEQKPITDVELIKTINNRFGDKAFDRTSLQECIEMWKGKIELTQSPVGKIVTGSSRLDLNMILSRSNPQNIITTVYARIGISLDTLQKIVNDCFRVSMISKISEEDGIYRLDVNHSTKSRAAFARLYMSFRGNDTLINEESAKLASDANVIIAQMTRAYESQNSISEFEEILH